MSRLSRLLEGLWAHRKRRKGDWLDHYPWVESTEPPADVSQAPVPDAEFSIVLYECTRSHPVYHSVQLASVFYCARDAFCDVLRANLAKERQAWGGAEQVLEWVESHPEGILLLSQKPADCMESSAEWPESHPGWELELTDGHSHWNSTGPAVARILERRQGYRVFCLHCCKMYEASAVSVGKWYWRSPGTEQQGRAWMCPERHLLWKVEDLYALLR